MTPLHKATGEGFTGIVQLLIEHGATVEEQDANGATALHLASLHGHLDAVERLIEAGAKSCLQLPYGPDMKTPLQLASEKEHTHIVSYLEKILLGKYENVN